ncbi:MAG: hypothetical protein ACK5N0_04880 [Synechococcaceae cyanobacterium]
MSQPSVIPATDAAAGDLSSFHRPVQELSTCLAQPSPLFVGHGVQEALIDQLHRQAFDKLFVISEPLVHQLYGVALLERLNAEFPCESLLVASGDQCKTFQGLETLLETLIALGASKRSLLIAFGGGAVGNLVGLAASLLFRGIAYVEIPTTMTGQTDSVLSNKQAINGRQGKNLFGHYHAPLFIWVDSAYLLSEPLQSRRSGIVEGIKNGFIADPAFLEHLATVLEPSHTYTPVTLHALVLQLIQSKLAIIKQDPSERQYGIVLEYGHTFGHGLEFLLQGRMIHGEAVGYGMRIAARLAARLGMITPSLVDLHDHLIQDRLGFAAPWPAEISAPALMLAMATDNKKKGRELRYVLLEAPGRCANPDGDWMVAVDPDLVLEVVAAFIAAHPGRDTAETGPSPLVAR